MAKKSEARLEGRNLNIRPRRRLLKNRSHFHAEEKTVSPLLAWPEIREVAVPLPTPDSKEFPKYHRVVRVNVSKPRADLPEGLSFIKDIHSRILPGEERKVKFEAVRR